MNEIMTIGGIDCYEENGTAYLKLEAVARGLGFTQTQNKNGKEYISIRWDRVREYLKEIGFPHKWGKDKASIATSCDGDELSELDFGRSAETSFATSGERPEYIPENVFYRLAMKAKNETAEKFQAFVADEVIPSIRKHGAYMTPKTLQEMLDDPGAMIEVLQRLKEEQARRKELETENAVKDQQIAELQPKAGYCDLVLQTKDAVAISKIAKDYGMSAKRLNLLLHEMGVQFKQGSVWLLYQKHADKGYTQTKTDLFVDGQGVQHTKVRTCWTQKGRLFIYELLKRRGILPLIERREAAG